MFGLQFLFIAALWALPLALLPLLLHLLFRRKSPVVHFSTLRFVKASLQQTAARRKVQRWLLLAVRILLLALLIWAVAQPAKTLASRWFADDANVTAAIVIDTSYSMQLNEQQITLLTRADGAVGELLRGPLQKASVVLLTSRPRGSEDVERFRPAATLLSQWTPLKPEPAPVPLVDRIAAAHELLSQQPRGQKWLFVLSDFQSREFPRGLPQADEQLHIIALDLHSDQARSAGISRLTLDPPQPIPGIRTTLTADIAGHPGDVKPVTLRATSLDGRELLTRGPQVATLSDAGRAQVRFDIELPAERWQLLTAQVPADAMPWDDSRTVAVEVGQRQKTILLDRFAPRDTLVTRFLKLALDPSEGKLAAWPLEVAQASSLTGQEQVAVVPLAEWPDAATAARLREIVQNGGSVILLIRPGLEMKWKAVDAAARNALQALLPSEPLSTPVADEHYAAVANLAGKSAPQFRGLLDDPQSLSSLVVQRVCPFSIDDPASTSLLLSLQAPNRSDSASRQSLLFRRSVGRGVVYTWAVLPDTQLTTLPTHPLFMPMLVSMSLRPPGALAARNAELGNPLTMDGAAPSGASHLDLHSPQGEIYRVSASTSPGRGREFVLDRVLPSGIYTWHSAQSQLPLGITSVQPPSSESELTYKPASEVLPPGENTLVVRSMDELQQHLSKVSQRQPKWSLPIAIALSLLCLETLMSSTPGLWKRL